MKIAIVFIIGVVFAPVVLAVAGFLGVLLKATRDTVRHWWLPLKDGYHWWSWFWMTPIVWWEMLMTHTRAWWNGYTTEIEFRRL